MADAELKHEPVRSGPELISAKGANWLLPEEITAPLVVFVHGFTAHGRYLNRLADLVSRSGYTAAYFNYDSYVGIDNAAVQLASRLDACSSAISKWGVVLVGHSMGGLVVRACVAQPLGKLDAFVKGIVLLGTPNEGTLTNGWMLSRLLDLGDRLTKFSAYFRVPACRAAKQITLSDDEQFILNLNASQRGHPAPFPTLTISGGLNEIELGTGQKLFWNKACNAMIQKALDEVPNDGLVLERSADLGRVLNETTNRRHDKGYPDYVITNHSALAGNQSVGTTILGFLRHFVPCRR
jgi:pimeloyl-ACP methyl ester carboxylesterase